MNTLHLLNTKVHEGHRQDFAYLIVRGPGDTHGPGGRQCLKPRGNVHTVAEEVSTTHHYVADVNSNPEIDALVGRDVCVRFGQGGLRVHRTLHRIHSTSKLRQDTVTSRVRYAAPVSAISLSRMDLCSVSPLNVLTSSAPMRPL